MPKEIPGEEKYTGNGTERVIRLPQEALDIMEKEGFLVEIPSSEGGWYKQKGF